MRLPWLDPRDDNQPFPPPDRALTEPDGLLAAGGSLSPRRLLRAYRVGIFPWYSPGQPILWWSPNPRLVLFPECVRIARSLRKTLRKGLFTVTADTAFDLVIAACAGPRGCTGWATLTRLKPGAKASWPVAYTGSRWGAYSLANPCSAGSAMPPR